MAIFHYSARIISRSKGQSSVAAAAYRAGARMRDERSEEIHNYLKKSGVDRTEILAPDHAPPWARDRAALWNKVEESEKRKDAQLAREVIVALPWELQRQEQIRLTRTFVNEQFVAQGMVADVAWHKLDSDNPHAHILLTTRRVTEHGFGDKERAWNQKGFLQSQREAWASAINQELERKGSAERVSHLSLKSQGIDRKPQKHVGKTATALERKGIQTRRGDLNREIPSKSLPNSEKYGIQPPERRPETIKKEQEYEKSQKAFRRKMAFLWATHQISTETYQKYTQGKGLPKTELGINWAHATWQISTKQANYLKAQLKYQQAEEQKPKETKPKKDDRDR